MRATKKTSKKKNSWENAFLSPEITFFYLLKLTGFFFGNRQQSNARAGSNAPLKAKKNIVALTKLHG